MIQLELTQVLKDPSASFRIAHHEGMGLGMSGRTVKGWRASPLREKLQELFSGGLAFSSTFLKKLFLSGALSFNKFSHLILNGLPDQTGFIVLIPLGLEVSLLSSQFLFKFYQKKVGFLIGNPHLGQFGLGLAMGK